MNDIDALPVEQQRLVRAWASRLKRLVKDAPDGIVAVIGNGSVEVCTEEELSAAFDRDGHLCGIESLITVHDTRCLRPYGESM